VNKDLAVAVAVGLERDWSPEQIAGWLKVEHVDNPDMWVSHETIYKTLFVQTRGVLAKELTKHLRTGRSLRKGKSYTTKGQPRGQIVDAVSISERPAEVEDRAVPGNWEGDLKIERYAHHGCWCEPGNSAAT